MFRYRNRNTGAVIETEVKCDGGPWEPVKDDKEPKEEPKKAKKESE